MLIFLKKKSKFSFKKIEENKVGPGPRKLLSRLSGKNIYILPKKFVCVRYNTKLIPCNIFFPDLMYKHMHAYVSFY